MNIAPGGLAGAMGALALDGARTVAPRPAAVAAKPAAAATATPAVAKTESGFQSGLFQARAVTAPDKSEATTPPRNPNLPRGSIVDLKV